MRRLQKGGGGRLKQWVDEQESTMNARTYASEKHHAGPNHPGGGAGYRHASNSAHLPHAHAEWHPRRAPVLCNDETGVLREENSHCDKHDDV